MAIGTATFPQSLNFRPKWLQEKPVAPPVLIIMLTIILIVFTTAGYF
jgi:hypothetical protein